MPAMTAQEAAEWGKTLDFPTVWAALMEDRKRQEEAERQWEKSREEDRERQKEAERQWEKSREEFDQQLKESREKFDQQLKKSREEFDQQMKEVAERFKETERLIKELRESQKEANQQTSANIDKLGEKVDRVTANVGGLNLSMGDLIETLFTPRLGEKFDAYNYKLRRMYRRVPVYGDNRRRVFNLRNGKQKKATVIFKN